MAVMRAALEPTQNERFMVCELEDDYQFAWVLNYFCLRDAQGRIGCTWHVYRLVRKEL